MLLLFRQFHRFTEAPQLGVGGESRAQLLRTFEGSTAKAHPEPLRHSLYSPELKGAITASGVTVVSYLAEPLRAADRALNGLIEFDLDSHDDFLLVGFFVAAAAQKLAARRRVVVKTLHTTASMATLSFCLFGIPRWCAPNM